MKTYTYQAKLEPGGDPTITVVTFPDVPEAITEGGGDAHALEQAGEALGLALLMYLQLNRPLPKAVAKGVAVSVAPDIAAKIAVIEAFRASGLTRRELARRIEKDEREAGRILDPMHATKLRPLSRALQALGQRLVVGVEEIERAA